VTQTTAPIAIIAGTGFYSLAQLEGATTVTAETAFGQAQYTRGLWNGVDVIFLTRHGAGHSVPPHLVNYRANIRALKDAGVVDVFAINVVGSVDPTLNPGDMLCLDDFLDFTKSRVITFFDGSTPEGVVHTDVMDAYNPELRRELLDAAHAVNQKLRDGGVYACFEGPRFESPAEIRMCSVLGAHVVGMTGVPEVTLAKEIGLRYAAVSLVVNPAAGLSDEPISMDELNAVLKASSTNVLVILDHVIKNRKVSS
jgi:5'-deoxy-5'-methylthioadenosine phosphorylase